MKVKTMCKKERFCLLGSMVLFLLLGIAIKHTLHFPTKEVKTEETKQNSKKEQIGTVTDDSTPFSGVCLYPNAFTTKAVVKANAPLLSTSPGVQAAIEMTKQKRIKHRLQKKREREKRRQRAILRKNRAFYNRIKKHYLSLPSNIPNYIRDCHSDTMSHEPARLLTCRSSDQYAYQLRATTDVKTGLRLYDNLPMVAVGSYYADHVGEHLYVQMENGDVTEVVVGDFKADHHTDSTNRYHTGGYDHGIYYEGDGSVIEFIVDDTIYTRDKLPDVFSGKIRYISHVPNDARLPLSYLNKSEYIKE